MRYCKRCPRRKDATWQLLRQRKVCRATLSQPEWPYCLLFQELKISDVSCSTGNFSPNCLRIFHFIHSFRRSAKNQHLNNTFSSLPSRLQEVTVRPHGQLERVLVWTARCNMRTRSRRAPPKQFSCFAITALLSLKLLCWACTKCHHGNSVDETEWHRELAGRGGD